MIGKQPGRALRAVALAAAAGGLVAACSGGSNSTSNAGAPSASGSGSAPAGGSAAVSKTPLIIARDMDINSLDPERAYCDTCQIFMTAVYETLIGLDPRDNKTLTPRLATSWQSNPAQTQFTFTLNPKATFADGTPVRASDVVFSWHRLAGLKGSASYLINTAKTITAPAPGTVRVTFAQPNSAFLAQVNASYMGVAEAALVRAHGGTADATTDKGEKWLLGHSAGSGPFALASYQQGAELRLSANPRYWGEPKPAFPSVVMKETKDAVTQLQQLQAGTVDIAMQISNDVAGQVKAGGAVTVTKVPSFNFVYLALSPGAKGNAVPLTPDVRKAVALALDYGALLDVTVGGSGRLQASPIPNGFLGSDGLALPHRDLAQARTLLARAGRAGGFALDATYPVLNVYGVDFGTLMQQVKASLKDVKIDVRLHPVELSVWANRIGSAGIPLTALYFAPDHTDPSQYVQYFGLLPGSQWQVWTKAPANPAESALFTRALATQDTAARGAVYHRLAQAMIDDKLIIPAVNPDLFLAYRSGISGVSYSACCNLDLGRLARAG